MKPVSTKFIFEEVVSEWHLDVFTHCLMQLRGTWSALTCYNIDILNIKIILKWKDTLNVKLKSPAGGSKSLLISESLRLNWII